MRNLLTIEVESYLGSVFISLLAAFFIGLIFIAVKNFNSDITIISSEQINIKTISVTERILIQTWIMDNGIEIPKEVGYRYLIEEYPSRPWLK